MEIYQQLQEIGERQLRLVMCLSGSSARLARGASEVAYELLQRAFRALCAGFGTGLGIQFNAHRTEGTMIESLSGGKQSLFHPLLPLSQVSSHVAYPLRALQTIIQPGARPLPSSLVTSDSESESRNYYSEALELLQ
jgi:hypothetical protein